jgi:hypothetical protein
MADFTLLHRTNLASNQGDNDFSSNAFFQWLTWTG